MEHTTISVEINLVETFLAATAALEVQMLVCLSVCLCVRHTCYNCTGLLKDFQRTSKGLPKDFGLYGLQNLVVYKSQPPGLRDLLPKILQLNLTRRWISRVD